MENPDVWEHREHTGEAPFNYVADPFILAEAQQSVVPEASSFFVWSVLSMVGVSYGWWRNPRRVRSGWHGAVARTGEIDPSAQGDGRKMLRSQKTTHQNATRELPQVTSAGARKRRTLCRQNDAGIGSAVGRGQIRVTTRE